MPEKPESPAEERPTRGGSFLRQADGSLVPEHPLPEADPLTTPPEPEASPLAPPRPQRSRPAPATEKEG